jgi:hypothetical protein
MAPRWSQDVPEMKHDAQRWCQNGSKLSQNNRQIDLKFAEASFKNHLSNNNQTTPTECTKRFRRPRGGLVLVILLFALATAFIMDFEGYLVLLFISKVLGQAALLY